MKKTLAIALAMISLTTSLHSPVLAESESRQIEQIASEINSIEESKSFLRNNIRCPDPTGCSGYGMWIRAVQVCRVVKAVNTRVGGKIFSRPSSSSHKKLSISKPDIKLMKMIYSQCKRKRYIDLASNPIELVYLPSAAIRKKIDHALF
jgi:hypothetical protein